MKIPILYPLARKTKTFLRNMKDGYVSKKIEKKLYETCLEYEKKYEFEYMYPNISMEEFSKKINFYIKSSNFTFFEVGSRDGIDAQYIQSKYPDALVYAFEAHPEEYQLHKEKNKNINFINLAIYDEVKEITFHSKELGSGIHSLKDRGQEYGQNCIMIQTERLDTYCEEHNIPQIDVMKLDVEGCSLEALRSLGKYINSLKLIHIETETEEYFEGQSLEAEVFKYLDLNNFQILQRSRCEQVNQHDSIWVSKALF